MKILTALGKDLTDIAYGFLWRGAILTVLIFCPLWMVIK